MTKHNKVIEQPDSFDLEAEQEGQALQKMNQNKIKKPRGQKPNARTVDVRVLEEVFDDVYGNSGYIAKNVLP